MTMSTPPPRVPDVAAASVLEPGGRWNNLIIAIGTYISGAELTRVSARDFANYQDTGVNWRVAEGYGTAIAAAGGGLSVTLDCPVRRIDHSGKQLKIETTKGAITADQAIITLPSAVLADMEHLFAPALPEKTKAARGLPLGLADKLFMSLADAEEFEPGSRLFGASDRSAIASYHLRPFGRPLIEAYFGGSHAAALEAGGEGAFFDFAVSELTGLLGSGFAHRVKAVGIHPWGIDPFARGSYSYALPGMADCRAALAAAGRRSAVFRRRGLLAKRLLDRPWRLVHRHGRRRSGDRGAGGQAAMKRSAPKSECEGGSRRHHANASRPGLLGGRRRHQARPRRILRAASGNG